MVEVSMELRALADRVEALTGPDREVDQAIARAVLWRNPGTDPRLLQSDDTAWLYLARCPSYTASLDAAMTLAPAGFRLMVSEWDDEQHLRSQGPWQAILTKAGSGSSFNEMHGHRCEHAATPALAVAAASLRARASLLDSPHTKGDEA